MNHFTTSENSSGKRYLSPYYNYKNLVYQGDNHRIRFIPKWIRGLHLTNLLHDMEESFGCTSPVLERHMFAPDHISQYNVKLNARTDKLIEHSRKFLDRLHTAEKTSRMNFKMVPSNATIREENIKCGNSCYTSCPHGPITMLIGKKVVNLGKNILEPDLKSHGRIQNENENDLKNSKESACSVV